MEASASQRVKKEALLRRSRASKGMPDQALICNQVLRRTRRRLRCVILYRVQLVQWCGRSKSFECYVEKKEESCTREKKAPYILGS